MTDDRRVPPPLTTGTQTTQDSNDRAAPALGAEPGSGDSGGDPARDPSPREIIRLLHQLSSRLDRVESRLNTALSRRKPDPSKGTVSAGDSDAARRGESAPPAPSVDTPHRPPPSAHHGLRPLMRDRADTDRLTGSPGLRAPVANSGAGSGTGTAPALDNGIPTPPYPGAPVADTNSSAASSSGYTNRREPARRRRGRGALAFILLLGVIGGGWWLAADRPSMNDVVDLAYTQIDRLLYGPETPSASGDASADSGTGQSDGNDPTPAASGPENADQGSPNSDGEWDSDDRDQTGETTAAGQAAWTAAPTESIDQGPAIEAAPREDVGAEPLSPSGPAPDGDLSAAAELPDDAPESLSDLAQRAANGDADAQHDLATAFALGRDIPQDLERAVFWYQQSAESGIPNALYNLGVLTRDGLGREPSDDEAVTLFRRAAERNHPDAQLALGRMILDGRGADPDPVRAAGWFQAASAAGEPAGALEMGRLFEEGLDGAADTAAAAGWYRIAAEAGNESAQAALERLVGETPDAPQASSEAPSADDLPPSVAPANAEPVDDPDSIRRIQTLLAELGFDPGPADGVMGDQTRNAIEAFQEEFSMPVTGEPSRGMIEDLEDAQSQD